MKYIPVFFTTIEKCVFSEQFLQEFKNPVLKILFTMYGILGGFWFDNRVNSAFRKVWKTYIIFNSSIVFGSCACYFMIMKKYDIMTIMLPLFSVIGSLFMLTYNYLIYLMRDRFSKLFTFLNEEACQVTDENTVEICDRRNLISTKNTFIRVCLILNILQMADFLINDLEYIVKQYPKLLGDDFHFFHYAVYYPYERNSILTFVIRTFQIITLLPNFAIPIVLPLFFYIFTATIFNKFLSLKENLERFSQSIMLEIDKTYEMESTWIEKKTLVKKQFANVKAKRIKLSEEFISSLKYCIRRYQKLNL